MYRSSIKYLMNSALQPKMILQHNSVTKLLQLYCVGNIKYVSTLSSYSALYNKGYSFMIADKSQKHNNNFIGRQTWVNNMYNKKNFPTKFDFMRSKIFHTLTHKNIFRNYVTNAILKETFSIKNTKIRRYLKFVEEKFDLASQGIKTDSTIIQMKPLVLEVKRYWEIEKEILDLNSIIEENVDDELVDMAITEVKDIQVAMRQIEDNIMKMIVTKERIDETDVIMEVAAGVGGQEAMLFTADILNMYSNYAVYRGWKLELVQYDTSEQGGVRKASAIISGDDVYKYLKYEGGVHRVQRVPKTEKSGRIHTSTMTVSVLPLPSEIDVEINPQKDLKITTMKAGGAGGQHVNKTDSAVRMVHLPTGLQVECQATRSQIKNKEMALTILRSKLYERKLAEQTHQTVTQKKLQVGSGGRSEKIRTYNFQQDRVTDHRIGESVGNVRGFLSGGEDIQEFIESLSDFADKENLVEQLEQYEKSQSNKD